MIVIAVRHEKQHVSSKQENVFIIMTRHGISPKPPGSDVFGLLWHLPRVFLIVFDRVQTNTNGIIYICAEMLYAADGVTGLHIWGFVVWKGSVYILQHIHMEDIDIWHKNLPSL